MYFSLNFKKNLATPKSLDILSDPHVTLAYLPTEEQKHVLDQYVGQEFTVTVIGYGNDGQNEGYMVRLPNDLPYFNKATPHITISVKKGANPVNTGYIAFEPIKPFELTGVVSLVEW